MFQIINIHVNFKELKKSIRLKYMYPMNKLKSYNIVSNSIFFKLPITKVESILALKLQLKQLISTCI